jgi:hypothetical protein
LIKDNDEIIEEDKEYKKAMYDRSRELEKVNKEKIIHKLKMIDMKQSTSKLKFTIRSEQKS